MDKFELEAEAMIDPLAFDPGAILANVFDALAASTSTQPGLSPAKVPAPAPRPAAPAEKATDKIARLKTAAPDRFLSLRSQIGAMILGNDDHRLRMLAAAGMNEGLGAAGGVLVQPEFAAQLIRAAFSESVLAPLCDRRKNSRGRAGLNIPAIDESSRADGSRWGGALAYWDNEGDAVVASQPKYAELELRPKKLHVLAFVSEELIADAVGFEEHIKAVFQAEGAFAIDRAIIAGSGIAQPLGFLNSPALITVPREGGQGPTVTKQNIREMWACLPVGSRRKAIWICNEDVESALADGADGLANVYQPAGTNGSIYPLLFGRPLVAMEQSPALGQLGDLSLVDMSQYVLLDLGSKTLISIHVKFVEDQIAVKFVWRGDGAPGWKTAVTSATGSKKRSPFVALGAAS